MTAIHTSALKRVKAYGDEILKIMFNEELIWPGETIPEDLTPYICFTSEETQILKILNLSATIELLLYSNDKKNWNEYTENLELSFGNNKKIFIRGIKANGIRFSFINQPLVYCSGNISTLEDYTNYDSLTTIGLFNSLFLNCTLIVSAPELPNVNLRIDRTYQSMFEGCSNLLEAPLLPSINLVTWCYRSMFRGCTSLVNAPLLPATIMKYGCYELMFYGCTSLVNAPLLPATNFKAESGGAALCYKSMFWGCTSLVNAPLLPATTLDNECYSQMFYNCINLVNAPLLPATTLIYQCYYSMFYGCASLNRIKMMALTIRDTYWVRNWLYGVSPTGTFVKNAAATWDESSVIPSGWTVQTATS